MKFALIALLAFWVYWGGGCSKNVSEFDETRARAEKGDGIAQYNLGNMFRSGEGVLQDNKEAAKWYRKAAEQRDVDAQYNLGVIYYHGQGVEQDFKEAVEWFRKATEQGDADAQHNLGKVYHTGEGVLKDHVAAYSWYNIAGANGDADAKRSKSLVARFMNPGQIAEAEELAKEMVKKNPKLINE